MTTDRSISSVMGNSQRLDGGAMFGNAPKALWQRWLQPDEKNRLSFATRAMLVRDGDRNILFEAGIGAFFHPRLRERYGVLESEHVLLKSLETLGLGPDDIDCIVLSHLHFDHAGGLLTPFEEGASPRLVFGKARFVVGHDAWERATNPHPRDRASFIPELPELLESSGRLELVDGADASVLGQGFSFWKSDGHTPGMLLTEVELLSGPVVYAADLIPGRPWVHVPITMGYDRFPERLIDEKRALLTSLVDRGGSLFFVHDLDCAMARVERGEKGRFVSTSCVTEVSDYS